jgi:propionate CoA-transferase
MQRDKVISAAAAARVVLDGDTVAVGGFVCVGVPEELLAAVETRFLRSGTPPASPWFSAPARATGPPAA